MYNLRRRFHHHHHQPKGGLFLKPIQLRYLLSVTGYSYEQASKEIGCTKQSIYNWVTGRTTPSIMAASILRRWAAEKQIEVPDEDDIEEIDA